MRSRLLIELATAGAVAFAVAEPALTLYHVAAQPIEPGRIVYAAPLTACFIPALCWLVLSAARDGGGRRERWALAALAAAILATVPLVGTAWLGGSYFILGGLVLLYVRVPWSLLILAGMAAIVTPITLALGHREWALFFTMGMPYNAVPLAIGVWLIRTARRLQEARPVLAEAAVVRERLRIERELRETVGSALEVIADRGEEARALATREPSAAARELSALVSAARATLAAARRLIARYREVSLRTELETAVTLLEAAGIRAELALAPGGLQAVPDEAQRASLRHAVARLLHEGAPEAGVAIMVAGDGHIRVQPRSSGLVTPQ